MVTEPREANLTGTLDTGAHQWWSGAHQLRVIGRIGRTRRLRFTRQRLPIATRDASTSAATTSDVDEMSADLREELRDGHAAVRRSAWLACFRAGEVGQAEGV